MEVSVRHQKHQYDVISFQISIFGRTCCRLSALQASMLYDAWIKFYGGGWKTMLQRDKKAPCLLGLAE